MTINQVRTKGRVSWYDPRKGYGYAARTGEAEVFLHYGAIREEGINALKAGQEIEFVLEVTERGAIAHDIRLA